MDREEREKKYGSQVRSGNDTGKKGWRTFIEASAVADGDSRNWPKKLDERGLECPSETHSTSWEYARESAVGK